MYKASAAQSQGSTLAGWLNGWMGPSEGIELIPFPFLFVLRRTRRSTSYFAEAFEPTRIVVLTLEYGQARIPGVLRSSLQ